MELIIRKSLSPRWQIIPLFMECRRWKLLAQRAQQTNTVATIDKVSYLSCNTIRGGVTLPIVIHLTPNCVYTGGRSLVWVEVRYIMGKEKLGLVNMGVMWARSTAAQWSF